MSQTGYGRSGRTSTEVGSMSDLAIIPGEKWGPVCTKGYHTLGRTISLILQIETVGVYTGMTRNRLSMVVPNIYNIYVYTFYVLTYFDANIKIKQQKGPYSLDNESQKKYKYIKMTYVKD